jgi:hypothetical protein
MAEMADALKAKDIIIAENGTGEGLTPTVKMTPWRAGKVNEFPVLTLEQFALIASIAKPEIIFHEDLGTVEVDANTKAQIMAADPRLKETDFSTVTPNQTWRLGRELYYFPYMNMIIQCLAQGE